MRGHGGLLFGYIILDPLLITKARGKSSPRPTWARHPLGLGVRHLDLRPSRCHGPGGQGDGPAAHILSKPPKNLISGTSKDLPDGYIYGAIRNGILSMPAYAAEIPVERRWQVVMYLRSMQQASAKGKVAGK